MHLPYILKIVSQLYNNSKINSLFVQVSAKKLIFLSEKTFFLGGSKI